MRQAPLMAKVEGEEEEEAVAEASPKELSSQGVIASSLSPPILPSSQGEIVHPDATYKYA